MQSYHQPGRQRTKIFQNKTNDNHKGSQLMMGAGGSFKDQRNNIRSGKKVELPRNASISFSYVEMLLQQMVFGINESQERRVFWQKTMHCLEDTPLGYPVGVYEHYFTTVKTVDNWLQCKITLVRGHANAVSCSRG